MKFSENSSQAAGYLRLAIPKMVQHNIVPNPLNYTLWYSYFSNAYPELNVALNQTIERFDTCPQVISEELFLSHITNFDNVAEVSKIQQALLHLASNLSNRIEETTQSTADHSSRLRQKLGQLSSAVDIDGLSPIIKELTVATRAICHSNDKFQQQIESARSEIESLKAELENTRVAATTDHLTGLFNRRFFESIYHELTLHNKEQEITLIMMDIDKFKEFNDTHGHNMGDQILTFVGKLLQQECAEPFVPVRLGGEEFAVLCPSVSIEPARELAETVRQKLAKVSFVNGKTGHKIPAVTASFGVALRRSHESIANITERADTALYVAKNNGRNQVRVAI